MHTYRQTLEGPWTVGFEQAAEPYWRAIADFDAQWKAASFASFLNGGATPPGVVLANIVEAR